jgi:outer membrane protein assembly factor BamA
MSVNTLRISILIFIISLGTGNIALAQKADSTKKIKLLPLPSVFFTPETSWAFGVTVLGFYTPKDTFTRKSNAQVFFDVTLMGQASFQSDFNIVTKRNSFYFKGSHDLSKFPEFYFGIGNTNTEDDHCLIDISYFDVKLALYHQLKPDFYLGTFLHHQNLSSINKSIEQHNFSIGEMGYSSTGTGLGLLIDKRNHLLNPSEGYYLETKISKYFDGSYMTKGFSSHTLDARYYRSFDKLVLNTNLYTVHNSGTVPFRMMPFLGGPRFMRGYYAGRFRDNNLSFAQAEVRRNLFGRIGVAAFTGAGQVYNELNQFNVNRFHFNYGGGLRFQLNKNSPANIRFDYGRTRDSNGFYIVFGECF